MAARVGPHEYRYSEYHLWAEPLDLGIAARIAQTLKSDLRTPRVYSGSWPPGKAPRTVLEIAVVRFEAAQDGKAVFVADWAMKRQESGEGIRHGTSAHSVDCPSGDYEALASALNRLLEEFGRELAGFLRSP
jgi:uncharacterized lipoprotein YmbA